MVKEWWWTFGKEKLGCQILQGGNGNLDAPVFGNGRLGFHTSSSRKLTSCFNIVAEQIRNTQKKSAAKKSSEQGIPGWGLPRRRGIGRTKYAMRCCSRAREVGDPGGYTGADAQAAGSGQYIQCPAKHWT